MFLKPFSTVNYIYTKIPLKNMNKIIRPGVIIIKNNKVLVLRSNYSGREFYLFPGGGMEGMESLPMTAVRETKEETNLDVKIVKLLYIREWIDEKKGKNVLDVLFLAKLLGGKETHLNDPCMASSHIQGIEWLTFAALKKINLYPKGVASRLEKDFKNDFKDCGVYLPPDLGQEVL
jgi:8-oxo-dGTP diphosphatase